MALSTSNVAHTNALSWCAPRSAIRKVARARQSERDRMRDTGFADQAITRVDADAPARAA